jgi:hypothetical protein
VNSITDASPTKPYVVKIMPGKYLEAVTLKDSISLVGSGPESTSIESTTTSATVTATNASVTLENLKLVQRLREGVALYAAEASTIKLITLRNVVVESYARTGLATIYLLTPSIRLEKSKIVSFGGGFLLRHDGWGVNGQTGSITLEQSAIESTSDANGDWALGIMGSDIVLRGSRVVIDNPIGAYAVMVEGGTGTIVDSEIVVRTGSDQQGAFGLTSYAHPVTIRGSKIDVSSTTYGQQNAAIDGANLTIEGSTVRGPSCGICPSRDAASLVVKSSTIAGDYSVFKSPSAGGTVKVGGSTLAGPHNLTAGTDKIVNSQDGDFNPLPNF